MYQKLMKLCYFDRKEYPIDEIHNAYMKWQTATQKSQQARIFNSTFKSTATLSKMNQLGPRDNSWICQIVVSDKFYLQKFCTWVTVRAATTCNVSKSTKMVPSTESCTILLFLKHLNPTHSLLVLSTRHTSTKWWENGRNGFLGEEARVAQIDPSWGCGESNWTDTELLSKLM